MKKIKELRTKLRISQVELAEKIGVKQSTVAMWECGASVPRIDKLPLLAKVLECEIADFFEKE